MESIPLNNGQKKISFLLTQFESLSNHIDTLISSSTMRVYSFLLIYTIGISVISFLIRNFGITSTTKVPLIFGGMILLTVGISVAWKQIHASVMVISYIRILNRIRNTFVGDNSGIRSLLSPLSFSDREPRSIDFVFDPGLLFIEILNATVISIIIWITFHRISLFIVGLIATSIAQYLGFRFLGNRKLKGRFNE